MCSGFQDCMILGEQKSKISLSFSYKTSKGFWIEEFKVKIRLLRPYTCTSNVESMQVELSAASAHFSAQQRTEDDSLCIGSVTR